LALQLLQGQWLYAQQQRVRPLELQQYERQL
jgi:hypothetical protein